MPDYPYTQIRARRTDDSTATVNVTVEEEAYGVDLPALVDAVKTVLSQAGDISTLVAEHYEMVVTTTAM